MSPDVAAALLRVMANPARLRILHRLLIGEAGVSAIEAELGIRQPALSQHLGALRDAGLLVTRRDARAIFYRLADGGMGAQVGAIMAGLDARPSPPTTSHAIKPSRSLPAARFAIVGSVA